MKQAIDIIGAENISTNQVEVHPFLQNKKLIEFCKSQDILVTAYMPLAYGEVMKDETISQIAKSKHGVSNADVSLSYLLDQGYVVIPSSTKAKNQAASFKVKQSFLDQDDQKKIQSLDRNMRIAAPDFSPAWD